MLTEPNIKEELSNSYINTIAAINGFGCEFTRKDFDSIDVRITCNGYMESDSTIRSPNLGIQLKATSSIDATDGFFPFPLPIKNYDDLRSNTLEPRILVLLVLPDDKIHWINHSVDELIIRKCAYWLNLKGMPESTNTTNKTVNIPIDNVLSPEKLRELMVKISKEEDL